MSGQNLLRIGVLAASRKGFGEVLKRFVKASFVASKRTEATMAVVAHREITRGRSHDQALLIPRSGGRCIPHRDVSARQVSSGYHDFAWVNTRVQQVFRLVQKRDRSLEIRSRRFAALE